MKFVLETKIHPENVEKIKSILIKHDIPYALVEVIPFSREITSSEPLVGTQYLPYGSSTLTIEFQKAGWQGQYFDPNTFKMDVCKNHRNDLLNDTEPLSIKDAIVFLQKQEPKSLWFTRPTEDLKSYTGQVIEAKECADWLKSAISCDSSTASQLKESTQIILSEPRNLQAEWRWFIVAGKVVDGSMYRLRGQVHQAHEDDLDVLAQAQSFANKWLPNACCVMDLALVDSELKLIEFNTINSSGFYAHDIEKIIVTLWDYFKAHSYDNNTSISNLCSP